MAAIQVKNVPDDLHDAARARAAQRGMSLSSYLLSLLADDLARPSWAEWIARIERAEPVEGIDAAALIREVREEREEELGRARRP